MSTTLFDTHEYIKRLESAGIPTPQAEAHAKSLAQAMDNELAKKADLNQLRFEVCEFRADVNGQFTLLKWMLGFLMAATVGVLLQLLN